MPSTDITLANGYGTKPRKQPETPKPGHLIFVDLDGTLSRTDLFVEGILGLLKTNPFNLFSLLVWLLRGRSYAKGRVASVVDLDIDKIPMESELLEYLALQKKQGRKLVLATASHRLYAEKVALKVGIFDAVIASEASINLKGSEKLSAIREYAGTAPFTYAGDHSADGPIWRAASSNIFVNAPKKNIRAAEADKKIEKIIQSRPAVWRAFMDEMRIHQYLKNLLVFVPVFTHTGQLNKETYAAAALAFICFCLCASSVYFLNDLLDLQSDRQHSRKQFRPLASGDLPVITGIVGTVILLMLAFLLTVAFLPVKYFVVLLAYFFTTTAYSFYLKRVSTIDVMTLAVLYTMRIVAGATATGIFISSWLMAFSVFMFVSLAYLKRYIEISGLTDPSANAHGRGYSIADSETMFSLGTSAMTGAVLILALYVNSDEVTQYYKSPEILWALCFLLLYWNSRLWVGARRGKIHDDPIIFAIKDNVSRGIGVLFICAALIARYIEI